MYEMIREQSIFALELKTPYSPVIHNPKAIANYQYLDSKYCTAELKNVTESAIIILVAMKLGVN